MWSAESRQALAAVAASMVELAAFTGAGSDNAGHSGASPLREPDSDPLWADPLRDLADACLEGLSAVPRMEAVTAALKVRLAADYLRAADALAGPPVALQDVRGQEMAVTAEVACVLTVGEGSAGAFLDPDLEPPPDPFPVWHLLPAWHALPSAHVVDPGWQEPLEASILEHFLLQCA